MNIQKVRYLLNTLAVRVVLFLSLALLPIGLIAVNQSRTVSKEAQHRLELSLIAWTDLAASDEREVIQRAFGAAEALSVILPVIKDDPGACYDLLTEYVKNVPRFSLIGFPDKDGQMSCSSVRETYDFKDNPVFIQVLEEQKPFVQVRPSGRVSGESIIIVVHPVFKNRRFDGYVVVSIPHSGLNINTDTDGFIEPLEVVTFNSKGEVLTSSIDFTTAKERLPADRSLKALAGSGPVAFREFQDNQANRIYTVTPILDDQVYALSIWNGEEETLQAASFHVSASLFPLLMWIASLVVAYMALNGLALRHIHRLRSQMDRFAKQRSLPEKTPVNTLSMARELRDMENDFVNMAQSLLQDEAHMEEAVREKNILLKEVHHRVKNNLQLISSIMNMHMRNARSAETKNVLSRLQDRILGLAAVHRNLYQTDNLNNINAGKMLSDVVGQMMSVGIAPGTEIKVTKDIADITLYPDQAVPLSLLTSEAITNALKYVGKPDDGRPWLDVTFARLGEDQAVLKVSNSKGATLMEDDDDTERTGLGAKLMRSFAIQLGAEITSHDTDAEYVLEAIFKIADFSHEAQDY